MEENKCGIEEIFSQKVLTYKELMVQVLRSLQFFHECGYLYRNIRPEHVMLNHQREVVLLDLKRMKKFVDAKGKVL